MTVGIKVIFPIILGIFFSNCAPVYSQTKDKPQPEMSQSSEPDNLYKLLYKLLYGIRGSGLTSPIYYNLIQSSPYLGDKINKVYHWAICPGYAKVPPENRVPFRSDLAAMEAGFK